MLGNFPIFTLVFDLIFSGFIIWTDYKPALLLEFRHYTGYLRVFGGKILALETNLIFPDVFLTVCGL